LQVKAEDQILDDVSRALGRLSTVPPQTRGNFKPLQHKYDLLQLLIEHERSRLRVWLFPLEGDRKHFQVSGNRNSAEVRQSIVLYVLVARSSSTSTILQGINACLGRYSSSAACLGSESRSSDPALVALPIPEDEE
jgi:hypothetical protein